MTTKQPWSEAVADVARALASDVGAGLDSGEAERRLRTHGSNAIEEPEPISALTIFLEQFRSLVVGLLAAAAAVAFLFQEWVDGGAVTVVIVLNALLGFATELHARRSMEALRQLGGHTARVLRDGRVVVIDAD
ncbi:MAG: cation-transporting P-type ATPase, partial [Thermoanaerobaculia bacterium]|nr:cation-transporting P-type ATPase [Thermoanaerobaculia bacterium]